MQDIGAWFSKSDKPEMYFNNIVLHKGMLVQIATLLGVFLTGGILMLLLSGTTKSIGKVSSQI